MLCALNANDTIKCYIRFWGQECFRASHIAHRRSFLIYICPDWITWDKRQIEYHFISLASSSCCWMAQPVRRNNFVEFHFVLLVPIQLFWWHTHENELPDSCFNKNRRNWMAIWWLPEIRTNSLCPWQKYDVWALYGVRITLYCIDGFRIWFPRTKLSMDEHILRGHEFYTWLWCLWHSLTLISFKTMNTRVVIVYLLCAWADPSSFLRK